MMSNEEFLRRMAVFKTQTMLENSAKARLTRRSRASSASPITPPTLVT